jgi:prepilin peptidase CpaA
MTISALAATAAMLIFVPVMVYAGVADLTTFTIRNRLLLLFLLAYVVLAPFAGFPAYEIGRSVAVAVAVLLGAFTLFALGWIGGGDAKLAAVTALWVGAEYTPAYLAYMALLGGAFTLVILQFRVLSLPARLRNRSWIARLHTRGSGIPYGVAMALAALVVFPHTRWVTAVF